MLRTMHLEEIIVKRRHSAWENQEASGILWSVTVGQQKISCGQEPLSKQALLGLFTKKSTCKKRLEINVLLMIRRAGASSHHQNLEDRLCLKQSVVKQCYGTVPEFLWSPSNFDDWFLVCLDSTMNFLPTYSLLRCLIPESGYGFWIHRQQYRQIPS